MMLIDNCNIVEGQKSFSATTRSSAPTTRRTGLRRSSSPSRRPTATPTVERLLEKELRLIVRWLTTWRAGYERRGAGRRGGLEGVGGSAWGTTRTMILSPSSKRRRTRARRVSVPPRDLQRRWEVSSVLYGRTWRTASIAVQWADALGRRPCPTVQGSLVSFRAACPAENKKVKARIIARQVKHFNDGLDTSAATATSVGTRALIALLADYNAAGGEWVAVFGDVKTAFSHAALPPDRRVFLRTPATEPARLWRAQKALYGLREAPRLFQEHLRATIARHGWWRLKTEPMIFVHDSGAMMSMFADDISLICPKKRLVEIRKTIDAELKI
eukprot:8886754-Heterocapsa_arctica.AAC.1